MIKKKIIGFVLCCIADVILVLQIISVVAEIYRVIDIIKDMSELFVPMWAHFWLEVLQLVLLFDGLMIILLSIIGYIWLTDVLWCNL